MEQNSPRPATKRARVASETSIDSPSKKLLDMGALSIHPKFGPESILHHERLLKIVTMLVKCMLPVSLVENPAFRDYIVYIDPSFQMPCVTTVKEKGLVVLERKVNEAIKTRLRDIPWVNVSLDLWSDAVMRPFNGFVCQGNYHKLISICNVHV